MTILISMQHMSHATGRQLKSIQGSGNRDTSDHQKVRNSTTLMHSCQDTRVQSSLLSLHLVQMGQKPRKFDLGSLRLSRSGVIMFTNAMSTTSSFVCSPYSVSHELLCVWQVDMC